MKSIEVITQEDVAYITFKEENKSNAMTKNLLIELNEVLDNLEKNEEVKFLIFKGSNKKFGAGVDLNEIYESSFSKDKAREYSLLLNSLFKKLLKTTKLTIAIIEGFAIGASFEMLFFIDINIAEKNTFFSTGGPRIGLAPTELASLYLIFLDRRFYKYIISAENITAENALELGIIDYVCEDPYAKLNELLEKFRKLDWFAIKNVKILRNKLLEKFNNEIEFSRETFEKMIINGNARKRITEFFKKSNRS